jgi:hypothetical protein
MSESSESTFDVLSPTSSTATTTAATRLSRPPGSTSSTRATTPTPTRPVNGGIESLGAEQIAWTGGPRAKLRTRPASTKAYRPSDYKSKRKCEEDCTEGIGDKFQLKTPDEIVKDAEAVLFVDWIDQLRMYMEDTGQDGVFYLQDEDEKEVYFLAEFGAFDVDETTKAVKTIKDQNCFYDASNLKTSGIAIRASFSTTMLQRIKGLVPVNASGPETLAAVVAAHQVLDSSGCRNLVEELRKMKLRDFPAENVDEFRLKVLEKGRRIEGCLQPPPDLPALIAQCFRGTQCVDFNMEVAAWYKKANRRRVTDWREMIAEFTLTYKTLLNNGEWPAATNRKEDVTKTIQGMFSKLENKIDSKIESKIENKLHQSNSRGRNGGNVQTETRSCHHCGKVGHIKPNCPELKPAAKSNNSGGGSATTQTTTTSSLPGKKRYEAPGENDSHTKKLGNDTWKWCAKCKRWNKGDSAHLTDEHRAKNKERSGTPPKTTVGRLAVSRGDGILKQSTMGFLGKVGRPVNKDNISWCSSCNRFVHSIENHQRSVEHCHSRGILLLERAASKLSALRLKEEAGQS